MFGDLEKEKWLVTHLCYANPVKPDFSSIQMSELA